jgi:hypothetical protein
MPVHPFNPDWNVGGSVLVPGHSSLIVEVKTNIGRKCLSCPDLSRTYNYRKIYLRPLNQSNTHFTVSHAFSNPDASLGKIEET